MQGHCAAFLSIKSPRISHPVGESTNCGNGMMAPSNVGSGRLARVTDIGRFLPLMEQNS